jgi:uncharacterized membrane protein
VGDDKRSAPEDPRALSSPSIAPEEAIVRQKQQDLLAEAPRVMEVDPTSRRAQVAAVIIERSSFSGPMPPPKMLEQYDKVVPGLAAGLFALTQEEAKHRREIEIGELKLKHRYATTEQSGVLAALICTLAVLGTVIYLAAFTPNGAVTVAVAVIVALASAFLSTTKRPQPLSMPPPPGDDRGPGPGGSR